LRDAEPLGKGSCMTMLKHIPFPRLTCRGGAPIGAGGHDPPLFEAKGDRWDKVNVENTEITTENISISVSQLQIKQRN